MPCVAPDTQVYEWVALKAQMSPGQMYFCSTWDREVGPSKHVQAEKPG